MLPVRDRSGQLPGRAAAGRGRAAADTRPAAGRARDEDDAMTALGAFEHWLGVVASPGDRQVVTSLARGRERGHQLMCGGCDTVLARDRAPMPVPAPVIRCVSCRSLNDLTQEGPARY